MAIKTGHHLTYEEQIIQLLILRTQQRLITWHFSFSSGYSDAFTCGYYTQMRWGAPGTSLYVNLEMVPPPTPNGLPLNLRLKAFNDQPPQWVIGAPEGRFESYQKIHITFTQEHLRWLYSTIKEVEEMQINEPYIELITYLKSMGGMLDPSTGESLNL